MSDINISDKFFQTLEDYHKTITNMKDKGLFENLTVDEKRGIFYNSLRRNFTLGSHARYRNLKATDLLCSFNQNGDLIRLKISKSFEYYNWEDSTDAKRLQEFVNRLGTLYPTRILNEMSQIVNHLK